MSERPKATLRNPLSSVSILSSALIRLTLLSVQSELFSTEFMMSVII